MTNFEEEMEFGAHLVKEATKITEWFKSNEIKSFEKSDLSTFTIADRAAPIYIISELKKKFAEDQIIVEEDSTFMDSEIDKLIRLCFIELELDVSEEFKNVLNYKGKNSIYQWTIDPIDGTKRYKAGLMYSIGISFRGNSETKAAAIAGPDYNQNGLAIFTAIKGQGFYISYEGKKKIPIQVSKIKKIEEFRPVHSIHHNETWVEEFANIIGITQRVRVDSMVKFCKVADGSVDFYLKPIDKYHSYSWDYSPGTLLVNEAGGKLTDLIGIPLNFKDELCIANIFGFIASNGEIHEEILEILKDHELVKYKSKLINH